jgi:methylthioribose-1-phosphate isomerase
MFFGVTAFAHTSYLSRIINWAEELYKADLATNKAIGTHGSEVIFLKDRDKSVEKVNILTHCNTGSLATSGYGTALGVVRALHEQGRLGKAMIE